MLRKLIRRLFCDHRERYVRTLYGDEIGVWGYDRGIYECVKCGRLRTGEVQK